VYICWRVMTRSAGRRGGLLVLLASALVLITWLGCRAWIEWRWFAQFGLTAVLLRRWLLQLVALMVALALAVAAEVWLGRFWRLRDAPQTSHRLQQLRGRNIARAIIFLPHVVSVAAVGIIWQWILDPTFGLLNYYLRPLGVKPVYWLTQVETALPALALTTIWWSVNGNMIIYLAGLQDIPEELYESARIDGANGWQLTRHITIPMLLPVNAFVIPLTVIAAWRVFGQAYVMTQGGPQGSTFTIAQYIFLTAFQNFHMGQAAAAGVILMLLTLAFTVVQLRAMKVF